MKYLLFLLFAIFSSVAVSAQQEGDSVLKRCPVSITDTATQNNYFIEARPVTLKVYRVKGKLTITFEQRDQSFSLFFHEKRLGNETYHIEPGSKGHNDIEAAYTFKSGDQVAFINVSQGTVVSKFDKEKKLWNLKVNGVIGNMSDRTVSYYRVKVDFWIK